LFNTDNLLFSIFTIFFLLCIPFALVGVKVLVLRYFEFNYTKKTLIHYLVMYGVLMILVIITLFIFGNTMDSREMFKVIYLPLLLLAILYEYIIIHKYEFDYEPKGQFSLMMVISHVADGMVLSIIFPIYLLLLLWIGIIISAF